MLFAIDKLIEMTSVDFRISDMLIRLGFTVKNMKRKNLLIIAMGSIFGAFTIVMILLVLGAFSS